MSAAQCWSFSKTGHRCGLEAGHGGDHEMRVSTTWTDAESWQPRMIGLTNTAEPLPVVGYPDLPTEKATFPCGACDWPNPETHDENTVGCRTWV